MKTKLKVSIQWIVMTGIIMISSLSLDANLYANLPAKHKLVKSDTERITHQIKKINNYSELLKTADEKKSEIIHRRIGNAQRKIRVLEDKLFSEANVNKHHSMNLPFIKYNFDAAENSLALNKFTASQDGDRDEFHLGFKTVEAGTARVDIVSPGGELLKSITHSDYNGSFGEEIQLNVEKGEVYFVHIDVDGKQTTKKLHFE